MELISTHLIKKSDLGTHQSLSGGQLLSWIDIGAATYAMEVCKATKIFTIKIGECIFQSTAKEGQILKIYGDVVKIGNTSITLHLEARINNVKTESQSIVMSTNITFVLIDENDRPTPISDEVRLKYQ